MSHLSGAVLLRPRYSSRDVLDHRDQELCFRLKRGDAGATACAWWAFQGAGTVKVTPSRPFRGEVTYWQRPVSLNRSYGHSRYERTAHVIEWRNAFAWMAIQSKFPKLDVVDIIVETQMSGRLQDIGNCYVSAKAAIDGIVLAGVIPDDTGAHLRRLTFLAPERIPPNKKDALTLIIEEVV